MAKSKALRSGSPDFKKLKQLDLMEDKEIKLQDIITSEVSDGDDDSHELWGDDYSKEDPFSTVTTQEEKLEQYLRMHSQKLSSHV